MVGGGGEAKIVISEGYVLLNDEVEFQKRKKVYHQDIIEFNGEIIQVNLVESSKVSATLSKDKTSAAAQPSPAKKKKKAKSKDAEQPQIKPQVADNARAKRKPISF